MKSLEYPWKSVLFFVFVFEKKRIKRNLHPWDLWIFLSYERNKKGFAVVALELGTVTGGIITCDADWAVLCRRAWCISQWQRIEVWMQAILSAAQGLNFINYQFQKVVSAEENVHFKEKLLCGCYKCSWKLSVTQWLALRGLGGPLFI